MSANEAADPWKAASAYIQAVTGCEVPHADGGAFCAALRDGVLLCQLANAVAPGIVPQVRFMMGGKPRGGLQSLITLGVNHQR